MGSFDGKFASAKQEWETPDSLFRPLDTEFRFTLDAAASKENAKAPQFFTKEEDGLNQDWGKHTVWLNPPFGVGRKPLSAWVRKAYNAAQLGAVVVMLLPARTNTNWFHQYCLKGEVRFIRGRPKFGDAKHGLPQPLCIVVFRATGG